MRKRGGRSLEQPPADHHYNRKVPKVYAMHDASDFLAILLGSSFSALSVLQLPLLQSDPIHSLSEVYTPDLFTDFQCLF